jgi:hypothetical protein
MFSDVSIIVTSCAGLLGAVATFAIGSRHTRNLRVLGWGGAFSGLALATLSYFVAGWFMHGFDPLHVWILPLACLTLLLVMTAQNWFIFYDDRQDVAQSARPALVVLAAAIASVFAGVFGDERTTVLQVIWAGAISLAILLSIQPVQRSIEVNRSVPVGMLVGLCKLLVPVTGIVVFVLADMMPRTKRSETPPAQDALGEQALLTSLLLLTWEIGLLPLLTLMNGARVMHQPALPDPADFLYQQKGTGSVTGQMPRSTRDTVVLILVLAVHVLCGVVIVRH